MCKGCALPLLTPLAFPSLALLQPSRSLLFLSACVLSSTFSPTRIHVCRNDRNAKFIPDQRFALLNSNSHSIRACCFRWPTSIRLFTGRVFLSFCILHSLILSFSISLICKQKNSPSSGMLGERSVCSCTQDLLEEMQKLHFSVGSRLPGEIRVVPFRAGEKNLRPVVF